ncbi:BAG family molecular chaperone regulator 2-like [Macrosteles quadrilineatus]|uniref:BAG family molecular chaperone regulator 2-like n=1 Tax=Macrosteles quadrilineatus TaxID=74068 RepID=UPI0023E0B4D7|nr:BAG family molecular chaperone regulator 2-like [Macrosteles quadrilineatus]XP_054290036.1 BAG family molecular chaperone regulator 2-like [Macrosteles quadrilineatus]
MDVDAHGSESTSGPHVDDTGVSEMEKTPKDRLLELLDQVELHVERLRKEAAQLEEERDTLFTTLDTIRNSDLLATIDENDREDILRYCERVTGRCLTVEVLVHTNRDRIQEDALYQVNRLIDSLVISIKSDPTATRVKCLSYMAACTSTSYQAASDKNFETAILGCTLDDQKRIRKRLQGLLDYMNQEPIISTID